MSSHSVSKSLGDLITWNHCPSGIKGETTYGKFRVLFYNESIVKVTATQQAEFDDFSYAVVATPQEDRLFDITEQDDHIMLSTKKFVVRIQKAPVRFMFLTHSHQVINEDDPAFGINWNAGQVTSYKKLQDGERFVGLGEKTGPLNKRGIGYQNWNTDSYAYSTGADPLYCSTPFYIGLHNQLLYGIFFDNTYKSFFNFGASNNRFASFAADAGDMNYFFIYAETMQEVIAHYTHITGRMEMPPLWSIGYQQCRYSYYPDKEVLTLAQTFRDKEIPADAIVFDIHYMDDYKIFTWSPKNFPDPGKLIGKLKEMGFHAVVICDPGIKIEEGYEAYEDGMKKNIFIKYPDGTSYTGKVWPGWCHFPDFTDPKARGWWQDLFKGYTDLGIEGFWNDMNEIATWGNMLPENIEYDFDGLKATTRGARNVYGFQMARSTYEGAKKHLKGKRPFNLTRAGYSGVQRYAAVWTGDNVAYDEHMILGARMISNMGLAGIAFAGCDIGGFVGDTHSKLFARWITLGAFSPFFRVHAMINSRDSEPWTYGEEVEQISRNYIKFRYQLLPYLYSLFYEATQTGLPVQRSLAIDYPHQPWVYDQQFHNQYLFGPFILVAPAESNKDFVKVYLPEGEWYYLFNGSKHTGNTELIIECPVHKLPVFIKGGAILPMQAVKAHTGEPTTELILHVYEGTQRTGFTFYEDDGETYKYTEGVFLKRLIELDSISHTLIAHACEGSYGSPIKKIKFVFHGFSIEEMKVNGTAHAIRKEFNSFFPALEKFDPFYDPEPILIEPVTVLEVNYDRGSIRIDW